MSVAVETDSPAPMAAWAPPGPKLQVAGLAVAVAIHAAVVGALLGVDPTWFMTRDTVVEMEVAEKLPPPEIRPDPPPSPPEPEPPPKIMPRRVANLEPVRKVNLPPPSDEPKPNPTDAPPVFGVTMSSVVSGDSAMAVPVGNTTMTKPRKPPAEPTPAPHAPAGTGQFTPVSEVYIATMPVKISEANSDEIYPPEAKKMGIEGKVELRLGIDETGRVKEAKVLKVTPEGYDFEVRARAALLGQLIKFSPAKTSDGKAVPFRITYIYRFELGQ
jgi:TonB family protein